MPFLAAIGPWLAANAAAIGAGSAIAGAGTSIGSTIYNSMNQPGAPSQPSAPPPATAAQNVQAEVAKRGQEALLARQQIPGLTANTGGGLSDQAYQTGASEQAGLPGAFGAGGFDMNSILQLLQGGGSGSSGGSGNTDLMNLASGSTGGSITG